MAQLQALPKKRNYDTPPESPTANARDAGRSIVPLIGASRGVSNKGFGQDQITPAMMGVGNDAVGAMNRTPQANPGAPAPATVAPPAAPAPAPLPVELQAQQANTGVLNSLTQQQNADTQGMVDRMAAIPQIQADFGGDVGAYQRSQDLAASGATGLVPRALNLSNGSVLGGAGPIQAYKTGFTNDDQRRIFAENQSLSVRQAKARDQRAQMRQDAGALIRTGTPEGIQAAGGILQQRSQVQTPGARTVYDLQSEREQRSQEIARAQAENPPRQYGGGAASQPRPALSPEKQAKVDAMLARMRAANTTPEQRKEIQDELFGLIDDLPTEQRKAWFNRMFDGGGDQAGPRSFASVEDAEKANLPKGTEIMINGRRAVVE